MQASFYKICNKIKEEIYCFGKVEKKPDEKFSSTLEALFDSHARDYHDQNIIGCGPSL